MTRDMVRSGNWKLHMSGGKATALYNLAADIGEKKNVLNKHRTLAGRLMKRMKDFARDISENNRPAAFVEHPKPLSKPNK
jgi:hypothetical protein